jgi:hypothetical protein
VNNKILPIGVVNGRAARAYLAEREGFEPPEPFGSTVFKTAAFDRSATSPASAFSRAMPHDASGAACRPCHHRVLP